MKTLLFYLKTSRPGLWFQTIWVYLLPISGTDIFSTFSFWIGFIYITFPLNFLVYGWNDFVDYETDSKNPRKDSFLWGAKGSKQQLAKLPLPIIAVQIPFVVVFLLLAGWPILLTFAAIVLVNGLYNLPNNGWRSKPPLELINICGMLLIVPLCNQLNNISMLPWQSLLYLWIFCVIGQLMGEIMDIEPDKAVGRKTTATVLGSQRTKILVIFIVFIEACFLYAIFHAYILASYMIAGILWLVFDLLYLEKQMPYSYAQYLLLGLGLNAAGYMSIAWVWYTGVLYTLPV